MYTLTRKLSVICLTVVLSFLVYGCGGSSKQALITDVSTDMVTAGLTPDPGTYTIQPGGTANAGDVTFTCPAEGPPCEVTVAEDGTVTSAPGSAPGMATAMDSASAAARLAAEQAQAEAETARDTANAAAMLAATAQTDAETARDDANAAAMLAATAQTDAETARDDANAAAMLAATAQTDAETDRDAANAAAMLAATAQTDAETDRDDANAAAMLAATAQTDAETARDDANAAAMLAATAQTDAETDRDAANAAAMLAATAQTDAETARDDANAAAMLAATAQTDAETDRDAANAAAMLAATAQTDAETDRDAANAAAMLAATAQTDAETDRDAANAAAMLAATAQTDAETDRDAANAAAMLAATAQTDAETDRDDANAAAMLAATAQTDAETERDDANAAAMLAATAQTDAETERDDANAAAMLAATAQTDAETARDAANAAAMLAATAQTDAETERDAANAAAMLAATAQTDAETERDAANTTAIAAVARAELLEMVNPFLVDSADGYGRVTPGVYEIASGGTNTEPGDDITFTCPADGPLCVVIVAVAEDGRPSYTSLGGAATGTNSVSATATIAARALHSPAVGMVEDEDHVAAGVILNTAGVNVPDTAVTRNTDGSETTITLTHDTGGATAIAVKYTSKAVDTGHKIDGWSGQTLKRSDDTDLPTPQEATVYTNIDPATKQKLKLGDGDEVAVTVPNATNVFVLDSGEDDDETINKDESSFRVAYNGVPGTFTCVGDTCADINTDTDDNTGQRVIDGTQTTFVMDGWTFESDDYVEAVATQDADYMYFGYWLQSPNPDPDPDVDTSVYEFATFFGGPVGDDDMAVKFTVPTELSGRERDDEALTATYKGGAAGRYVTRKLRIKDQGVDPQSPGYTGRFTARATLTAHFGEHKDFDAGDNAVKQPETHNTIGGTITDFRDGATDLGFEITLKRADINANDGATSEVSGVAMAKFSETATSTAAADNAGAWSGDFYGPVAVTKDEATDDMPEEDASTKLPSGVAGQFNASSPYTSVVGVFGAEKQ